MRYLIVLVLLGIVVHAVRDRQARQWIAATIRSAAVYCNLRTPDHGALQLQVLLGARRRRCVSVNGVTRLPAAFQVTFAESDRPIVQPVEERFFADVIDALLTDAQTWEWEVDGVPTFSAVYADGGRPGFPVVSAVPVSRRREPAVASPSRHEADGRTTPFPSERTEVPGAGGRSTLQLREIGTDRVIALDPTSGAVDIGRGDRCDIRLRDPAVSGRHARIAPGPSGWTLVDRASTNGTFVNGNPAATPTNLHPGDVIRFGSEVSFLVAT